MNEKERILIVITKSNWGGAQRHVFDLAKSLQEKNLHVTVALGGNGVLISKLNQIGIKTYSISSMGRDMKLFKDFLSLISLYKIIKKEKPTVIHSHSPKAGGLSCFLGRILKIPKIIYTVHGWPFQEDRPFKQQSLIKIFSFFTVLFSHKTIVLTKEELLNWPLTKNKFEIIPIALNEINFFSKEEAREQIGHLIGRHFADDVKIVGTIAELHKNKSLDIAIKSMKHTNDVFLIIIGEGEERKKLTELIEQEDLKNKVFITGFLPEASKYLKAFNIFLLSSIKEGMPYVILEAGLAELPIIATKVGGIPSVIENHQEGILVFPRREKEIASAISFLLKQKRTSNSFAKKFSKKVKKGYLLSQMIEKIISLYQIKNL